MFKKLPFIGFAALLLGTASCETEFSLNGDYELTPVVFGLLDETDSVHFVKITKAFLGDDDNLLYAQNADSSYFKQVDARVIEYNEDGDATGREWELKDTVIGNKSTDGIFYAPDQKVYYFFEKELENKFEYEIVADFNEGQAGITSRTNLINGFKVPSTLYVSTFKIRFANNTVDESDDYLSWRFEVTEGYNAARYELSYTFNWTEHYVDGTSSSFSATRREETEDQNNPDKPGSFNALISGIDFFQWVGDIIPDDPNVEYRTNDGFDLHISVAHKNLSQYMDVADPVSGIAQIQPVYTNIDGGYGLWSNRQLFTLSGMRFDASTAKELSRGQYTVTKLFCSDHDVHASEDYYCP